MFSTIKAKLTESPKLTAAIIVFTFYIPITKYFISSIIDNLEQSIGQLFFLTRILFAVFFFYISYKSILKLIIYYSTFPSILKKIAATMVVILLNFVTIIIAPYFILNFTQSMFAITPDHFRTNVFTRECNFGGYNGNLVSDPWWQKSGCTEEGLKNWREKNNNLK